MELQAPVRVPTSRYTSPEWALWRSSGSGPTCGSSRAPSITSAAPGDFFEHRIGRLSVLIVRGDDGELRAFQNVCRHRGNPLCDGSGQRAHRAALRLPPLDVGSRGRAARGAEPRSASARWQRGLPAVPGVGRHVGTTRLRAPRPRRRRRSPTTSKAVPDDIAWAGLEDFRCTTFIEVPVDAQLEDRGRRASARRTTCRGCTARCSRSSTTSTRRSGSGTGTASRCSATASPARGSAAA